MKRVILYTGKGGVGKSTVSASTGLQCSRLGYRTLIYSMDMSTSLSDTLQTDLGTDPSSVAENLWALELDPHREMEARWEGVEQLLHNLFQTDEIELSPKELALLPGLDIVLGWLKLADLIEEDRWDVVIIDSPPPESTLRNLTFAESVDWYYQHTTELFEQLMKFTKGTVARIFRIPKPDQKSLEALEAGFQRILGVMEVLRDPDRCSIRLVASPRKLVVKDSERIYMYLTLFEFPIDAVIINKVLLPRKDGDRGEAFVDAWRPTQERNLEEIHSRFGMVKILQAPLLPDELVGQFALGAFYQSLFGSIDPTERLSDPPRLAISEDEGNLHVEIPLQFLEASALDVHYEEESLVIQVGQAKRVFLLPAVFRGKALIQASYQDGTLTVQFGE